MAYDIPSISDLEATQLLNKHYAEVVTSKKDGIASGSDITQTTNPITGVTRRTLYKILDDMDETFLERLLKMAFTPVGTFTEGATLTDARQILLWEVSEGGDGHYYSWSGTFPKAVTAGSSPSPIEAGSWVDRTDDSLRDEIRETVFQNMKRLAAEAGFNLVDGSFEEGAVISGWPDVVWSQTDGKYYQWYLDEAKTIAAGSTPMTAGGIGAGAWVDRTDLTLRNELTSQAGYKFIPSVTRILSVVPVEQFRDGVRTDTQIIQSANDYAKLNKCDLLFEGGITYTVTSVTATCKWKGCGTIMRKPGTTEDLVIVGDGGSVFDISVDGSADTLTSSPNTVLVTANSRFDIIGVDVYNAPGHVISVLNTPVTFAPSRIDVCIVSGSEFASDQASKGAGIYLYNALNVQVTKNSISKKSNGILAQGNKRNAARLTFSENTIHQNFDSGLTLALISEAVDQQAYERIIISKNSIFSNGGTGIVAQCDLATITDNVITGNGSQSYHQGILVNANGVSVSNNIVKDNAGVGIDFGDCKKCSALGNHIEGNGWLGIEVNSCEQINVVGNIINRNLLGKTPGDMQAAILVHSGDGGYPFLGLCKDISISANSIGGGDGQQYAILVADQDCINISITGNNCKNCAFLDDIVSRSSDVMYAGNYTRWDAFGLARAVLSAGVIMIPSVADVVQVNGTGDVTTIGIQDSGAYIKDRTVRIYSVYGMTLKNSGGAGGNLYLESDIVIPAGDSVKIWSDGSGGFKKD